MAYQSPYISETASPHHVNLYNDTYYAQNPEGRTPAPFHHRGNERQDPHERYAQGAARRAGMNARAGKQGDPARMRAPAPRIDDDRGIPVRPYGDSGQPSAHPQHPQFQVHPGYDNGARRGGEYDASSAMRQNVQTNARGPSAEHKSAAAENFANRKDQSSGQDPMRRPQAHGHVPWGEAQNSTAHNSSSRAEHRNHQFGHERQGAGSSAVPPHGRIDAPSSSRPGTASRQKILNTQISPDTLAWDNPFPTFPAAKKRKEQLTPRNELSDSMERISLEAQGSRHQNEHARPQAASSKSSYETSANDGRRVKEKEVYLQQTHPRPSLDSPYGKPQPPVPSNQWGSSALATRHSEDNHRPVAPTYDVIPISNSQRSRTMPSTIERPEIRHQNQPISPTSPTWQEQGPTAGYYGPVDKAFLSNADSVEFNDRGQPIRGPSSEQPHPPPQKPRPPVSPQKSFSDVYDSYFELPDNDTIDPGRDVGRPGQHLDGRAVAEDTSGSARRRGFTIDKHLQTGSDRGPAPPIPPPHRRFEDQPPRGEQFAGGLVPRSRSQPDPDSRRHLLRPQNSHFDFQLPRLPPATAPAPLPQHGGINSYPQAPAPFNDHRQGPNGIAERPGQSSFPINEAPSGRAIHHDYPYDAPVNRSEPNGYWSPPFRKGNHSETLDYIDPGSSLGHGLRPGKSKMSPPPAQSTSYQNPQGYSRRSPGNGAGPRSSPNVYGNSHEHRNPPDMSQPSSTPTDRTRNPDALPPHPAPIRPTRSPDRSARGPPDWGHSANPYPSQAPPGSNARPPPVRNYDHEPHSQQGQSAQSAHPPPLRNYDYERLPASVANAATEDKAPGQDPKRQSTPITGQELQRRRQKATVNPRNLEAQFSFGKGLAEASRVLLQAADPKERNRERDRYQSEALRVMKKLVSEQYPDAMFFLGDCYSQGRLGLAMDAKEAFTLYQSAAKAGHAASAFRVAVCCEMGLEEGGGTKRDLQKAIQWYTRAATLGDTPAMYKVGIIRLKGLLSQPANPTEALGWLEKAAERADAENPHALHELVCILVNAHSYFPS